MSPQEYFRANAVGLSGTVLICLYLNLYGALVYAPACIFLLVAIERRVRRWLMDRQYPATYVSQLDALGYLSVYGTKWMCTAAGLIAITGVHNEFLASMRSASFPTFTFGILICIAAYMFILLTVVSMIYHAQYFAGEAIQARVGKVVRAHE